MLVITTLVSAEIDRHPELKSRAVAWTEYDGSYLLDTSSRADMLDFYWTVFARPYPPIGWTGSDTKQIPGETSELWRIREYAQLNAYRALNYSQPMAEDPSKLEMVQAGALIRVINPGKPMTHYIDATWIGYNQLAATALASSLLTTAFDEFRNDPLIGSADAFVDDGGLVNAATVGHRTFLLHDASIRGTVGAASASTSSYGAHAVVWNAPMDGGTVSPSSFIAYPSPGYIPIGLFRYKQSFRWSFAPMTDDRWSESLREANVAASINGKPVALVNVVTNYNPSPVTWQFSREDLDIEGGDIADGTTVDISVANVRDIPYQSGLTRSYHYTVTLFDEQQIIESHPSPRTPLVNISTRSAIGEAERQVICGFSVEGDMPVRVALRTQGPGLAAYGIKNPAHATHIRVFDDAGNLLGENGGWKQHQDWRMLQSYDVAPRDDHEAGMVLTLWPGRYSAVVSDDGGEGGIGIVEAFNIDNLSSARLVNLSTRGLVGTGENVLIAGFVIKGSPRTIVIRTQGPGLAQFGVANPVADTLLKVVAQDDGRTIAENDDWRTGSQNARLSGNLASYAPGDPREAALVLRLEPGAYSALVSGKDSTGVGIVELFDLPE